MAILILACAIRVALSQIPYHQILQIRSGPATPCDPMAGRGLEEVLRIEGGTWDDLARGSPLTQEIQDKPIPASFKLSMLEAYDGGIDLAKHVATFRAQMAFSISSFDQLVREFESNFLANTKLKPTVAALLALSQKDEEPLSHFISYFATKIRVKVPRPIPVIAGVVNKQIEVIVDDPTFRGDSTSGWKAYARAIMEKRPHEVDEPQISFESREVEYPDHGDVLVISVRITNALVKRVMVDTGSSVDILYKDAFLKLGLTTTNLSPMNSTLIGFTRDFVVPLGMIVLPITLSQEHQSKTLMVTFMVVGLPTTCNIILGWLTLNRLRAVVSTYHRAMKFPTRAGLGRLGAIHESQDVAT
ncbi:hypothetical protein BHE74_00027306 [Ensete ventricosum]|nr:hypothetical protein BHE74_00027306 [Ensete ventricosum]